MPAHNPQREDLYHIAGDPEHGVASTMRLTRTALGHPQVRYKDRVMELDVYEIHGRLMVHLLCPRCANALKITDDRKQMEYDARANVISIEAFRCTWELDPERRMEFGVGMCNLTIGITKNVARDA